jgi:cytochrome c-type biogenesis protein CcmF
VEISGLLPWLFSFGLMHSMRLQISGRPFKRWVYFFSFSIAILILLGILITRSGILESVHAYASGGVGPALSILILLHAGTVIFSAIYGRGLLPENQDKKRTGLREKLFRWFNFLLVALVLIYLFGQTLPLTSQVFTGEKTTFKPEDYERTSAPILLLVVIITALCPQVDNNKGSSFNTSILTILAIVSLGFPIAALFHTGFAPLRMSGFWATGFHLLSWLYALAKDLAQGIFRKEGARRRRGRYGMQIIHLGLAVMAIGILGVETLTQGYDLGLVQGESMQISDYQIRLEEGEMLAGGDGDIEFVESVLVAKPDGKTRSLDVSIVHISKTGSLYAKPAILPGFFNDLQVVLEDVPPLQGAAAEFRVTIFPLMSWIWAGGALMAAGGFVSLAGGRRKG